MFTVLINNNNLILNPFFSLLGLSTDLCYYRDKANLVIFCYYIPRIYQSYNIELQMGHPVHVNQFVIVLNSLQCVCQTRYTNKGPHASYYVFLFVCFVSLFCCCCLFVLFRFLLLFVYLYLLFLLLKTVMFFLLLLKTVMFLFNGMKLMQFLLCHS